MDTENLFHCMCFFKARGQRLSIFICFFPAKNGIIHFEMQNSEGCMDTTQKDLYLLVRKDGRAVNFPARQGNSCAGKQTDRSDWIQRSKAILEAHGFKVDKTVKYNTN